MSVRTYTTKSGELRHQAQVWSGNRVIKSKSFVRKLDAKEWVKREELKLLDSKIGRFKGVSLTLNDFFHEVYWPQKEIRDSTAVDYWTIYTKHISPQLGEEKMAEVSDDDWNAFFKKLQTSGTSASRVNRIHTVASALYSKAVKAGYVRANPLTLISYLEEGLHGLEFWTETEVQKFLKWALETENPRFPFYLLAYETGMRLAEIQGLSRDCINFDVDTIIVRRTYSKHLKQLLSTTKSGRSRMLGMSKGLKECLQKHLNSHPFDLVFSDKNGNVQTQDQVRWAFFEDLKKAGVRRIKFHSLRHTFASHFVMRGGSIYDLKELLGHSQIETTMRYAHLSTDHLKSRANIVTFRAESPSDPIEPPQPRNLPNISHIFENSVANEKRRPSYLTLVKPNL